MIASWAKNLNEQPERILYEYSYANLLLYGAATPQYDDKEDTWNPKLDANDPNNFTNITDEIYV